MAGVAQHLLHKMAEIHGKMSDMKKKKVQIVTDLMEGNPMKKTTNAQQEL